MDVVYVLLLNEGSDAWVPVHALKLSSNEYLLQKRDGWDPEDEELEFIPGMKVRVVQKTFSDGDVGLVAIERVSDR